MTQWKLENVFRRQDIRLQKQAGFEILRTSYYRKISSRTQGPRSELLPSRNGPWSGHWALEWALTVVLHPKFKKYDVFGDVNMKRHSKVAKLYDFKRPWCKIHFGWFSADFWNCFEFAPKSPYFLGRNRPILKLRSSTCIWYRVMVELQNLFAPRHIG